MTARTKFENVEKLATCKRCGDTLVAWREGKKWYLVRAHVATNFTPRVACAPREFHVCIPEQTASEIDEKLAALWLLEQTQRAWLYSRRESLRKVQEPGSLRTYRVEALEAEIDEISQRVEWLRSLAKPFEAEYLRRGRWNRYFLVTNSNGHVHRGMDCSTCFDTTQYAWLVNLSDCDEEKMVDEYGTMACTVCFPDAPTLPGWARHAEQAAAEKAEKAAAECTGSRSHDYEDVSGSTRLYRPWAKCNVCGEGVSITSTGKMRAHKRPVSTTTASAV